MQAAPSRSHPPLPAALSPAATRLSYAGLIPLVAGALLVWLVRPDARPFAAAALAAYGALSAAFVGGIHWALAMRSGATPLFAAGALLAVGAWAAVLMPPAAGLVVDGALLWAGYAVDRRAYPLHGLAQWLTVRFRFSGAGGFACFLGAAGT